MPKLLSDKENLSGDKAAVEVTSDSSLRKFLTTRTYCNYYHRGHWVFMNNYYMSPQTLEHLETEGLHSCGTVQANRKELSKDMSKKCTNCDKPETR